MMSEGDTEKVGIACEDSLKLTFKIRGSDELKITENVIDLIDNRTAKSLVGKQISIYVGESKVGQISVDALLWSITKNLRFTY